MVVMEINKELIVKRNEELLKQFLDEREESPGMRKYYEKKIEQIFKLKCGLCVIIDKPSVKTKFCYGYGYCGISSMQDMYDAQGCAEWARSSEEHFIIENMKDLNEKIKRLEESLKVGDDSHERVVFTKGNKCEASLSSRSYAEYWNLKYDFLDNEDLNSILRLYYSVRENFKKRLNTYLKKYGLTKIESWTYLVD